MSSPACTTRARSEHPPPPSALRCRRSHGGISCLYHRRSAARSPGRCGAQEGVTRLPLHISGRMRSSAVLPWEPIASTCSSAQRSDPTAGGRGGERGSTTSPALPAAPRGGSHFSTLCQHHAVPRTAVTVGIRGLGGITARSFALSEEWIWARRAQKRWLQPRVQRPESWLCRHGECAQQNPPDLWLSVNRWAGSGERRQPRCCCSRSGTDCSPFVLLTAFTKNETSAPLGSDAAT